VPNGVAPDRVAHVDALAEVITGRLSAHPAATWFSVLTPLGVPCGPVNDLAEAFGFAADLGIDARVTMGEGDTSVTVVANPIALSASPATYRRRQPQLDEHTTELRHWLDQPSGPT
jgi:crotonobetainyl-CoA:carnitine CoA-transferase CaiB-like acyl-CoA transferase